MTGENRLSAPKERLIKPDGVGVINQIQAGQIVEPIRARDSEIPLAQTSTDDLRICRCRSHSGEGGIDFWVLTQTFTAWPILSER